MNVDNEKKLLSECPNLYRMRYESPSVTCMYWGFDVDDGWFEIIYELSKKLEALILKIPEDERERYCASQVKEKYGTLRFYMHGSTDEMEKLITEAEQKTAITCERCSAPGKERTGGWILTLCDACAEKRDKPKS